MVWFTHLITMNTANLTQQGTASVYGSITRQTACSSFIAFHKHSLTRMSSYSIDSKQ